MNILQLIGLLEKNIINIHQYWVFLIFLFSEICIKSHFYFYFYPVLIMGKDIDGIYKHSQSQLSTPSIKKPVFPSSASQTSSSINSTRTCVSSIIDKDQTDSVLCSQNTIHNDLNITNNNELQSCETPGKTIIAFQPLQLQIIMHNISVPRQWVC